MKYHPQLHGRVYDPEGVLPTENWHLQSASAGTKSMATAATELQYLVREFRVEIRNEILCALRKPCRIRH